MNRITRIILTLALTGMAGAQAADIPNCTNQACFEQAVQDCQPAQYSERHPLGQVRYEVMEAVDGDHCRVSMTYTDNPNPAWENQPLTFVLDTGKPIEPQLKQAVKSCMTGAGGDWQCAGPLLAVLSGGAAVANKTSVDQPQQQTSGKVLRGTATVFVKGDKRQIGWGEGVLIYDGGNFYITYLASEQTTYKIEKKDGQLVVSDTDEESRGVADRDSLMIEATGKTATVAGITGEVYVIGDPSSDMHMLVTLTDDPRVAAITKSIFSTMSRGAANFAASVPKPGILRLLDETGKTAMELISVSDKVPDYYDAVVQAAKDYVPEKGQ